MTLNQSRSTISSKSTMHMDKSSRNMSVIHPSSSTIVSTTVKKCCSKAHKVSYSTLTTERIRSLHHRTHQLAVLHQVLVSVQPGSTTSSVFVKRTRHVSVTVRSQRNCSMTLDIKSVKSVVNTGRRQDVRVVLVGSTLSSFATRAAQVG